MTFSLSLTPALKSAVDSLASTPVRTSISVAAFAIGTAALAAVLLLSDALADLSRRQLSSSGAMNIQVRTMDTYWLDGIAFPQPDATPSLSIGFAEAVARQLDKRATVVLVDSAAIEVEIGNKTRGIAVVSRRAIASSQAAAAAPLPGATVSKRLDAALTRESGGNRPGSMRLGEETVSIVGLEPNEPAGTALAVYVSYEVLSRLAAPTKSFIVVVPRHQVIDDEYKSILKSVEQVVRRDSIFRGRATVDARGPGQLGRVTQAVTVFRLSFAALALLCIIVAGLGAANVVLLATVQRAREIGIRRSVGATRAAIRAQFAAEALAVALVGGVLGLVLGRAFVAGVAAVIASRTSSIDLTVQFTAFSATVPMLTSIAIGLIAASFPAAHAARVDPASALREE